jgi:hypothetical protein
VITKTNRKKIKSLLLAVFIFLKMSGIKRAFALHFSGRLSPRQKTMMKTTFLLGYTGIGFAAGCVCAKSIMLDCYDEFSQVYKRGHRGLAMTLVIMAGVGPSILVIGMSTIAWPVFIPLWTKKD